MKFRDNFELIGNLRIVENLDKNGDGCVNSSSWNFLKDFFNEKFKSILAERGQKKNKILSIVKD